MQAAEVLQIFGGQVLLPILIFLILWPNKIWRHPLFVNFCVSFVLFSVIFSLSTYNGHHGEDQSLGLSLCVLQAALVHGATPMVATANVFMILQIWQSVRRPSLRLERARVVLYLMILAPYLMLAAASLPVFVTLMRQSPQALEQQGSMLHSDFPHSYFCSFEQQQDIPLYIAMFLGVMMMIPIIDILQFIYRYSFKVLDKRVLSSFIRAIVFMAIEVAGVVVCVVFTSDTDSVGSWWIILQASFPLLVVLVFGTTRDIYFTVCFWMGRDASKYSEKRDRDTNKKLPNLPESPGSSQDTFHCV